MRGAPGRQSDRTGLLDFFSHQNMQTSKNKHRKRVTPLLTIVLRICDPVFWAVQHHLRDENRKLLSLGDFDFFDFFRGGGPKNAKIFFAFLGTI